MAADQCRPPRLASQPARQVLGRLHDGLAVHPLLAYVLVALAQGVVLDNVGGAVAAVYASDAAAEAPEPGATAHETLAETAARHVLLDVQPEIAVGAAVADVDSVKVLHEVAQLHPKRAIVGLLVVQFLRDARVPTRTTETTKRVGLPGKKQLK